MNLTFNYFIPRQYTDSEGNVKYALCHGGDKMEVDTLENAFKMVKPGMDKAACPWLQVFSNGYRVTNDNIRWEDWNGVTFADIDSKLYYNNVHRWDINLLLEALHSTAEVMFKDNYYCSYVTGSGKGYRIVWYWDCDRTEDNFIKCSVLTESYTRKLFYSLGDDAKKIIDYEYGKSKVLDNCSKSIKQGMYVTGNKVLFSGCSGNLTGTCSLADITINDTLKSSAVVKNTTGINQHNKCTLDRKVAVSKDDIKYHPHHHRWCIYEALVRLFGDKKTVDKEWKQICTLLPEHNGHTRGFYEQEPKRNRWFERYSNDTIHSLHWLTPFGYQITDELDYIYHRQFSNSWKKHIKTEMFNAWLESSYAKSLAREYADEVEAAEKDAMLKEFGKINRGDYNRIKKMRLDSEKQWREKMNKEFLNGDIDVMDDSFLENLTIDEKDEMLDIKKHYYDSRWKNEDFPNLIDGYKKPQDIVTYKMYADLYYRDEDNKTTLQYDIREDDIRVFNFDAEQRKIHWHTFKYSNEYTHWKNNDTFDNKCCENDLMKAVNKFVPRWFGYNSVIDYFNSLDLSIANEELLETWAIRHFQCDDTPLTRFICKSFFVAAVKKQFIEDPSTWAYPHILLIQGPTGCGKTFFLKTMFTFNGHELILNKVNPNDSDAKIGPLIAKNMLIQFGEGAGLKKVDVQTQKEFVDRVNMAFKYQKKYENEQTTTWARTVICRTSNDDVLFNDVSINEGDRRNLLLVCKCPPMACDAKMRDTIMKERDILWATAYKLYLEKPWDELQLDNKMFDELNNLQEGFKLTKKDDIDELYRNIFERKYTVNSKKRLLDEKEWLSQVERSEALLSSVGLEEQEKTTEFFHGTGPKPAEVDSANSYIYKSTIDVLPAKWLSNYVKKTEGINTLKILKDYLEELGWTRKQSKLYNLQGWVRPENSEYTRPGITQEELAENEEERYNSLVKRNEELLSEISNREAALANIDAEYNRMLEKARADAEAVKQAAINDVERYKKEAELDALTNVPVKSVDTLLSYIDAHLHESHSFELIEDCGSTYATYIPKI